MRVVLVLTVWFGIRRCAAGPATVAAGPQREAANLAVLICALRLGEVFGATTASIALSGRADRVPQAERSG